MTTAILEGMAQKRLKELQGKRGAHEAHNKTEELPRKTLFAVAFCTLLLTGRNLLCATDRSCLWKVRTRNGQKGRKHSQSFSLQS